MGHKQRKKKGNASKRKNKRVKHHSHSSGLSQAPVIDAEKRFCHQLEWWKDFSYDKETIKLYPNVLNWDDSASKEAFDNAKSRYWAEINNLSCGIPLPDPNMYVQEVDSNAHIDPRLLEDLYKQPPPIPPQEIPSLDSIKIVPTGWDVVDPSPSDCIPKFIFADELVDYSGYDDSAKRINKFDTTDGPITIIPTGWGDEKESEIIDARDSRQTQMNDDSTIDNIEKNKKYMLAILEAFRSVVRIKET